MARNTIKQISYEQILSIWKRYLWADRTSPIEPNSAMLFLHGYDMKNMNYKPTFFGYIIDGKLAGVNSGHMCMDNSYRSRGLFVFKKYRNRGIGTKLLLATVQQGFKENANFIWSYPRQTSWNTYKKAGFILRTDWKKDEIGYNAFCIKEK